MVALVPLPRHFRLRAVGLALVVEAEIEERFPRLHLSSVPMHQLVLMVRTPKQRAMVLPEVLHQQAALYQPVVMVLPILS